MDRGRQRETFRDINTDINVSISVSTSLLLTLSLTLSLFNFVHSVSILLFLSSSLSLYLSLSLTLSLSLFLFDIGHGVKIVSLLHGCIFFSFSATNSFFPHTFPVNPMSPFVSDAIRQANCGRPFIVYAGSQCGDAVTKPALMIITS